MQDRDNPIMPGQAAGLVIQKIGEESVIYGAHTGQAYLLDKTTNLVFDLCDGKTSVKEAALRVGGRSVLDYTLGELAGQGLLDRPKWNAPSRREFLSTLGRAAAVPVVLSMALPQPSAAVSGACAANCGGAPASSCSTIGQPSSFPPTGCFSCCGTCGFFGTSCPTCPGDCATCFCMYSINIVRSGGDSCGTSDVLAIGNRSCVKNVEPLCVPPGACQKDCAAARIAAIGAGKTQYACCTNCV